MLDAATNRPQSEQQFATLVDALAADPSRCEQLTGLLREDHSLYDQRGSTTIVRMRGWVLLALARSALSDEALIFVLEELDAGTDAYLVAAAARALRSYPSPTAALAPFVMRALTNIRYRDEPVSFDNYGEYATSSAGTSAVSELLATLVWLGPRARGVLPELESLCAPRGGLAKKRLLEVKRAVAAIRGSDCFSPSTPTERRLGGEVGARSAHPTTPSSPAGKGTRLDKLDESCCTLPSGLRNTLSWALGSRRGCGPIEQTVFEDHEGTVITFKEFFPGHPSIVVFFYTRCDNPLKCSLTVTKLARIQKLLEAQGLAEQIQTAAITYDPAFDLPERMRGYGQNRGVHLNAHHRMLRATEGVNTLRSHFKLGVNFIESLVNRHRIELYILDAEGRIAASFERIHWDEQEVVNRALEVLHEKSGETPLEVAPEQLREKGDEAPSEIALEISDGPTSRKPVLPIFGTLASLGVAFFPKCPICWAAYLSVFGIAGLNQIPYAPWLYPVLVAVMLINLVSVWLRGRRTGRLSAFYLVSAGALVIVLSKIGLGWAGAAWQNAAPWGVALTLAGSLLNALNIPTRRHSLNQLPGQARRLFQYLANKERVAR